MTNRISRRAIACALYATTAYCGMTAQPAQAQVFQPQKFRQLDSNGVDVTWGDYVTNFVEGSIGSGQAKLELIRNAQWRGGPTDTSSNNLNWDRIFLTQGTGSIDINIGSRFEQFTSTGSLPSGSTLSGGGDSYTYQTADGTTIEFGDPTGSSTSSSNYCNGTQTSCTLLPILITTPDGRATAIHWDVNIYTLTGGGGGLCDPDDPDCDGSTTGYDTRINSVSNSFGYRIAFTYASNSASHDAPEGESWHKRTGASFFNDHVSTTTAQASVSYSYPSTGVTEVTDTGGRVWRFTGTVDRVTGIRRPGAASDTISVSYDANGKVSSVTNEGVTTTYSRSVAGSTATMTITDALAHQTVVTSDLNAGRPTAIRDALNRTTSFQYDASGRQTRTTLPEGNYTQLTYDARGNVIEARRVAKAGSGQADIVTTASYDSTCTNPVTCNEPNSTTDAKGNVTNFTYDATHGGVLSVTQPAPSTGAVRPQTRYSYVQVGGAYLLGGTSACQTGSSCTGTSDEVKAAIGYDANGNVTSVSKGNGPGTLTATEAMTYDAVGNLLTVDGPLAGAADTTRYRYDAARELAGVTAPDPDGAGPLKLTAIRNTYANALLTKRELGTVTDQSDGAWATFAPAQAVDIGYDANARPVTSKLSAAGTNYSLSQVSYDALGRTECSAVRMNPAAYGSLPSSACMPGTEGSFGPDRISQVVYDAAGQPTQLKVAVGTADAATERTLTYSANGLVTYLLDGENNLTAYQYDGFDRPSRIIYSNPNKGVADTNGSDNEQFVHDPNGNVTDHRNRDGSLISFSYDNLDRLTLKDRPGAEPTVNYAYDNLGRLTSASQTGINLAFGYDALSRQTSEAGPLATVTQQFDLAGRRTQFSTSSGLLLNYQWLTTGQMKAVLDGSGTPMATFSYDDFGRRTGLALYDGTSAAWSYDGVSRLASLTHDFGGTANDLTKSFAYNPASQITSETRSNDAYAFTPSNATVDNTSNGLNQLTNVGGSAPAYDANGNLTFDPTTGKSYTYDSENRLVSASGGVSLTYDPLGRLYEVTGPSGSRRYLYAPGASGLAEPIMENDGSGAIFGGYGFGPGPDEPLFYWDLTAGGVVRTLHADERGSIVAVGAGGGNVAAINRYDGYGNPQAGSVTGRFGFTGQMWLPEVGAYYYKNRMYSPALGRFMQTDPIGPADDANLYAYVGGDPVNLTDPLGQSTKNLNDVICTGTRINAGCGGGGIAYGLSGFSSAAVGGQIPGPGAEGVAGGFYVCTNCGAPATTDRNGQIIVPAPNYVFVGNPFGSFDLPERQIASNPMLEPYSGEPDGGFAHWFYRQLKGEADRHIPRINVCSAPVDWKMAMENGMYVAAGAGAARTAMRAGRDAAAGAAAGGVLGATVALGRDLTFSVGSGVVGFGRSALLQACG